MQDTQIDMLRRSARQIVRELGFMHSHLAGTQLSPSAVHTIIELGLGTVASAHALGDLLHLEKSSVSRLLKKLQRDGLVKVSADKADKRARKLELTGRGAALLEQIEDHARGRLRSALSRKTGPELSVIEDGLFAFAAALGSDMPQPHMGKPQPTQHSGYQPALIAGVTGMHAAFYSQNYGFGALFERKVASEMSEFMGRIDAPLNAVFSAYNGKKLLGSVSIDGEDLGSKTAHLRWFIVSPEARGLGVGKGLMARAMKFVDEMAFQQTCLWTFKGLDTARHLYERFGFELFEEKTGSQWGIQMVEQQFRRALPGR